MFSFASEQRDFNLNVESFWDLFVKISVEENKQFFVTLLKGQKSTNIDKHFDL